MARLWVWLTTPWRALDEAWPTPVRADPSAAVTIWLVCCISLFASNYGARNLYDFLPNDVIVADERYARKVFWALGVFVVYTAPGVIWARATSTPLRDVGIRVEGLRGHLGIYVACLAFMSPLIYAASLTEAFRRTYPMAKGAGDSLGRLLGWELSYGLQFVGVEFLFRGLFLFGVARALGGRVAVAAMVPSYLMLHFGKPPAEALGSVIAGLVMGTLALHSRSIWPGVALHVAVAWSMDLLSLAHAGRLAQLF